ncbi:rRNA pseudouridine synthase [Candidatus Woesearchaeota archaeon]|jgi:23S rRNA pseudouridine2605 synthase|nr:rRNA pseudouridine synthase [Candidatus Woesearchaeota archaeon]MBT4110896.1 rRNA pseudouridine synthase [Candidatus Woesearchaeota archaeon]MBT4336592.1 rRNA pseudouridine synthase [Candidatus Woesearchaeota archaeon]MBT4469659.1 rRNA pseudouridine synthase [Candidatus Woesearchaeota archaeon]MBT6744021.1 rRNA pseudouridine synthase [Candidatus Woesearchaeota archaeon]
MERVQKILSNRGFCSRRKAEQLIKEGRVKVNGKTISIGDQATNKSKITVDNDPIDKPRRIYLMFNKPNKCITALTDPELPTVMEYIDIPERVFPVGRLDYNTTGLLLLTNDGDFANRVMHPRNEVKKTYQVKLTSTITDDQLRQAREGIDLRDGTTRPARIKKYDRTFFDIVIHEGKNQIIKRMFKKMGFRVKSLKRVAIGRLTLGKLKPGEFKELTKKEIDRIFVKIVIPKVKR